MTFIKKWNRLLCADYRLFTRNGSDFYRHFDDGGEDYYHGEFVLDHLQSADTTRSPDGIGMFPLFTAFIFPTPI